MPDVALDVFDARSIADIIAKQLARRSEKMDNRLGFQKATGTGEIDSYNLSVRDFIVHVDMNRLAITAAPAETARAREAMHTIGVWRGELRDNNGKRTWLEALGDLDTTVANAVARLSGKKEPVARTTLDVPLMMENPITAKSADDLLSGLRRGLDKDLQEQLDNLRGLGR